MIRAMSAKGQNARSKMNQSAAIVFLVLRRAIASSPPCEGAGSCMVANASRCSELLGMWKSNSVRRVSFDFPGSGTGIARSARSTLAMGGEFMTEPQSRTWYPLAGWPRT